MEQLFLLVLLECHELLQVFLQVQAVSFLLVRRVDAHSHIVEHFYPTLDYGGQRFGDDGAWKFAGLDEGHLSGKDDVCILPCLTVVIHIIIIGELVNDQIELVNLVKVFIFQVFLLKVLF